MINKPSIRVQNLTKVLTSKFLPAEQINRQFSSDELQDTFYAKSIQETYESLGGMQDFPKISFQVPFIEFGRFCVLLDEPLHFNRYRAKTLRSPFYESLSSFPLMKFRTYCRKHEVECMKAGTSKPHWTNMEAEFHFGSSQESGDLGLKGSAGWKLTAFKDLLTDIISRHRKIRLLRLAVWDDLMIKRSLKKFNEILRSPGREETEQILKFVERKIVGLYADDF